MKLSIASDLHLEFSSIDLYNTQNSDVLVLAGDILIAQLLHQYPVTYEGVKGDNYCTAQMYRSFLKTISEQFKHIIYVAGNHEFYHGKFYKTIDYLKDECSKYNNIHFLEQDSIEIDNVVFIGATCWTDCNNRDPLTVYQIKSMMSDYLCIRNDLENYRKLNPEDTIKRHSQTISYFKNKIAEVKKNNSNTKIVIVTHHAPSFTSIHPNYKNDYIMNGGYFSDLSPIMLDNPEIVLWVHGHVHHQSTYNIGNCQIICNPRGYHSKTYNETTNWDQSFSIEI